MQKAMNRFSISYRVKRIKAELGHVLVQDRANLYRDLNRLHEKRSNERIDALDRIEASLNRAIERKRARLRNIPKPRYPQSELPILAKKETIIEAIAENRVVIIAGETGSGKTTQIPKFCIEAGRGCKGIIGCTQPRRIAAMTVARRIAHELGCPPNGPVGYKIRFDDKSGANGIIKIMTDGILLAETLTDRWMNAYDTLIIDEAHERSLNIDFILGLLRNLLCKRRDLKIIITSATIDTKKFAQAFDNAPVIEVSGRLYPVETRYQPPDEENPETLVELAGRAVARLLRQSAGGDMLVFMPTEQDIRDSCDYLKNKHGSRMDILPLFGRLSSGDQARVFKPGDKRKVIVATNIAETSITLPGIRYVVDTGLARIARYTPRTRTTALPVVPISRSSADQRKGRCGRMTDGICVRLYSQEDYEERPLYTPPEILRANLAEVILRMISLRLGKITRFPFIDAPDPKSVKDGIGLLLELGAIRKKNGAYQLTPRGRLMARLPMDPRLARMLIEAHHREVLPEMTVLAAALSIQDPRERPLEKQAEADSVQAQFNHPDSDFLSLLQIWRSYQQRLETAGSQGRLRRFCRQKFLSFRRMREWRDIHRQLCRMLNDARLTVKPLPPSETLIPKKNQRFSKHYAQIHSAILSGYLSNIACKKEGPHYLAPREREVMLHPGSTIFNSAGQWIVAAEMVQTSRLFARCAATVMPEWIEEVGKELCKTSHLNPHWERNRETAMVSEQVSLYGLTLAANRKVPLIPIDPDKAAEIFIQCALVEGDVKTAPPFLQHNLALIEKIREMEDRLRRRDLLVEDQKQFDFYHPKLPDIRDLPALTKYLRQKGGDAFLRMKQTNLMNYDPDETELDQFPDQLQLGDSAFNLSYDYAPGQKKDGISVQIPVGASPTVPAADLGWVVPGLLQEKITRLIHTLPKAYRHRLMPIGQVVDDIVAHMPRQKEPLLTALGRYIQKRFQISIPVNQWRVEQLPEHLRLRLVITDPDGKILKESRDPNVLNTQSPSAVLPGDAATLQTQWERKRITAWDFGALPVEVTLDRPKGPIRAWPALAVQSKKTEGIDLKLFFDRQKAQTAHLKGVAALAVKTLKNERAFLKKASKLSADAATAAVHFGGVRKVSALLLDHIFDLYFSKNIRDAETFFRMVAKGRPRLTPTLQQLKNVCEPVLIEYNTLHQLFAGLVLRYQRDQMIGPWLTARIREMKKLVPDGFIALYAIDRMRHLPRYLKAMALRAERGALDLSKDRQRAVQLTPFEERLRKQLASLTPAATDAKRQVLEDFFWLTEEFKVSLFAQELKTAVPVSAKRLQLKLTEIEQME